MDDLDGLLAPVRSWHPKRCRVAQVLDMLDAKDAAKLAAAADDPQVPAGNVIKWIDAKLAGQLPDAGIHTSSVTQHRARRTPAGGCSCP